MIDLPQDVQDQYTHMRDVPHVGICGVHRLMFHWTVHIGIDDTGYDDRYCFATEQMAKDSLDAWDGTGDMPDHWHKHPSSGRRRNPSTGAIWHEMENRPDLERSN
jgi:hypothetical protein